MLNKKHISTIAALSLSAVLLTGCQAIAEPINIVSPNAAPEAPAIQPTETTLGSVESAVSSSESSIQTAVSSDTADKQTAAPRVTINVNCTLPTDTPEQVAILKTKPFWFEDGLPEELLLKDVNYKWAETRDNEYFPEIKTPIYDHAEEETLLLGYNGNQGGDLFFRRYDEHMYGSLGSECGESGIYDVSFTDSALDGFTPEEAVSKAKELLGQLGITTGLGTPEISAVKADKANEYLSSHEWYNKDGSVCEWKEWTKDDEVYYITFPVEFNGIPVATSTSLSGGMTQNNFEVEGTYIQMTVGRNEIMYVNTYDLPAAETENIGTAEIKISAQQALDIFIEHHNAAEHSPSAFDLRDVSLVYAVTKGEKYCDTCEAVLIPMWKFESTYEWESDHSNVHVIEYVDAQTGKGQFEF